MEKWWLGKISSIEIETFGYNPKDFTLFFPYCHLHRTEFYLFNDM